MADIQNGRHLKAVRVFAELTQKELAEKAEISLATLSVLEGRDLLPLIWSDKISSRIHKVFDDMGIDILENCGMQSRDSKAYVSLAPKPIAVNLDTSKIVKQKFSCTPHMDRYLKDWKEFISNNSTDGYFYIEKQNENGTVDTLKCHFVDVNFGDGKLDAENDTINYNVKFKYSTVKE